MPLDGFTPVEGDGVITVDVKTVSEQLQLEDEEVSITLRRAWDRALRLLATRVNKPTFETHIRAIRPVSLTEETEENATRVLCRITLGVPSAFTREWVEKRHASLIAGVLEEVLDRDVRVQFVLSPRNARTEGAQAGAPSGGPSAPPARTLNLFGESEVATSLPATKPTGSPEKALPPRKELPSPTDVPPAQKTRPAASQCSSDALLAESIAPAPTAPSSGRGRSNGSGNRNTGEAGPDSPQLNPRYTFDNFVVGPSNRLAHAGARAVAQSPGQVYNPLFFYGPSGLGKTHLMHAIGNEAVRQGGIDPARIAYVSGEAFTSHYITSLREHRAEEFRRRWRSVDLWLVDDIQFIAGKEHTKEEFFHTFNALYQLGKQIVICSDRSPRDLRMMDERLRSRFECGLIADIASPDLETRLAILHRKAETERMRIPDDVLLYMARLVQSNIRTLEGALVRLIAYASLVNTPVTIELAAGVLERYYINPGLGIASEREAASEGTSSDSTATPSPASSSPRPPASVEQAAAGVYTGYSAASGRGAFAGAFGSGRGSVTPDVVQRVVAKRFGLTPDLLTGKKRDRDIVLARQIAMHLMRELTEMSLPGIGQIFGGRDHSTVSHACDRVRSQIPLDEELRSVIEDLTLQVRAQVSG